MKSVPLGIVGLAIIASGLFGFSSAVRAQDGDPPPSLGPIATITFADGTTLTTSAQTGLSDLVALNAQEAVQILLAFPTSLAGQRVEIQSADGGVASSDNSERFIAADGTAVFAFQIGVSPGQYRVTATAGGAESTIRLWVADPENLSVNPRHLVFRPKPKTR